MRTQLTAALLLLAACATAQGPAPLAQPPEKAIAPAAPPAPGLSDQDLGLSRGSLFEVTEPRPFKFVNESPGGNDRLPRAWGASPPRIPHDIAGYLPITLQRNQCLKCHDVEKMKEPEDPTPIPPSHHVDWRNAPGVVRKEIAGARWVCTSCHVPQAQVPPPVENRF